MPKPVVKFDSPAGLFLAALKRCPDRPAFVLSGSSLSYREAGDQIARLVREMAALPGDSLCLRIADHGLWAMALIASELAGKAIDPKSPRTLQDSDLQRAIQSGPAAPLPAGPARVAPAAGCEEGDVFANLLPYSSPELVREMAALPGDSLALRIADHGLWAMGLIAAQLAGKAIAPKSPSTLQDSDLQQAIQSGPAAPLPAGPGRVAPASGCKDGDVFANLLPYSSPEVVREELCACLSVGGCLWFCEDPRGFTGLLSRIRPHCLVLDRAGLSALAESLETWGAREAGLDRLRRIVCTQAPTTAQKTALEKLGVSLETA